LYSDCTLIYAHSAVFDSCELLGWKDYWELLMRGLDLLMKIVEKNLRISLFTTIQD
jgi:hypothetical protein